MGFGSFDYCIDASWSGGWELVFIDPVNGRRVNGGKWDVYRSLDYKRYSVKMSRIYDNDRYCNVI